MGQENIARKDSCREDFGTLGCSFTGQYRYSELHGIMAKKKPAAKKKPVGSQTAAQKRAQEIRALARKKAKEKLAPPPAEPTSPKELAMPATAPSRAKQRQVKAAAKNSRLKQASIGSQIHGHIAARGRRAQGRRDSKGS